MKHHYFNSFWYGRELSPLEWSCLSSFLDCGHRFRLFCYQDVAVPQGVSLAEASTIVHKDKLFLADGSVSAFSDLFRYEFILKYGEWWVDTDVVCNRDDIPDCSYAWAPEDPDTINGAILRFPKNDPKLLDISRAANSIGNATNKWCELGPHILTDKLSSVTPKGHFGTRNSFYPVHWLETFMLWLPNQVQTIEDKSKSSYFVHLWSSMFSKLGLDPRGCPPKASFLHKLYKPYMNRFKLSPLPRHDYNRTLETIKTWIRQDSIADCSDRKLGYDVSKFEFDEYWFGRWRWWFQR